MNEFNWDEFEDNKDLEADVVYEQPSFDWDEYKVETSPVKEDVMYEEEHEEITKIKKESKDRAIQSLKGMDWEIGFGDFKFDTGIDLDGETAAFLVGLGHKMQSSIRGLKQMANIDLAQEAAAEEAMNKLYAEEELGGYATAGGFAGAVVDPIAVAIPLGRTNTLASLATKVGGVSAGLGYIGYKGEDESRIENALVGGALGVATAGAFKGAEKLFRSSDVENPVAFFEREVAERKSVSPGMSWQEIDAEVREDMPNLWKQVVKTGRVPRPDVAYRDLDLYKAEDADIPIDTLPASKEARGWINSLDRYTGIVSTRVDNISHRVFGKLRTLEANLKIKPSQYKEERKDFADYFDSPARKGEKPPEGKFTSQEVRELKKYLYNGDIAAAKSFIQNSKGDEALQKFEKTLSLVDRLGDELVANGVIKGKIDNYFPRLTIKGKRDEMLDKINEMRESNGRRPLTAKERDAFIGEYFGHSINFAKQREVKIIPDELIDFYENPLEALDNYIHHATKELELVKFLGKDSYQQGLIRTDEVEGQFNFDRALRHFVQNSPLTKDLSVNNSNELHSLLKHRFYTAELPVSEVIKNYRSIVNTTLLANPISAATQLGDLGVSSYKNGFYNTIKAATRNLYSKGKTKISKDVFDKEVDEIIPLTVREMGLEPQLYEEFADMQKNAAGRVTDFMFKWSGFNFIDTLGKETFVDAALGKAIKNINNMESKAYRSWAKENRQYLGSRGFAKLQKDLKAYSDSPTPENMTDEIKIYLMGQLSDVQPIYLSEQVQAATGSGAGRVMYTLKSFMFKQLDILRRDSFAKITSDDKKVRAEGVKNLGRYVAIVGAANLSVDHVKSLALGEEDLESLPEVVQRATFAEMALLLPSAVLKTFGMNAYTTAALNREGPEGFLKEVIAPPLPLVKELSAFVKAAVQDDINKQREAVDDLAEYIPLAGRWLGRGEFMGEEFPPPSELIYGETPVKSFAEGGVVRQ